MYSNPIAEPSANFTFAHIVSDNIQRYSLHTLHARNEQRNISADAANNVDNPTPANPNLVTIDINRICLDICKFHLSQIAPTAATQAVGAHDPVADVGNAPILAADTIELAPAAAQNVSIDEEERGLGPTSTTATVT
ncbi:uncharacterized protein H6S33_003288 [Morchella sextelata]|uniref:uncharacterized protein n=1 Tax=Morchella sextelata TaxID=1174677 RepID=UPI001D03C330|nr:uncharacterized protein H6S33_003288 [Morchella sextelata]KAH0607300.1 hypothetical protein H6S33_003288 [Morchella sextelata]